MLKDIDYIVMRSNKIEDNKFNDMVDSFINMDTSDDGNYEGFFNTKTIYRVK